MSDDVDHARAVYAQTVARETTAAVARQQAARGVFAALRARQAARIADGIEAPPVPCRSCLQDVDPDAGWAGHRLQLPPGEPPYATCDRDRGWPG